MISTIECCCIDFLLFKIYSGFIFDVLLLRQSEKEKRTMWLDLLPSRKKKSFDDAVSTKKGPIGSTVFLNFTVFQATSKWL